MNENLHYTGQDNLEVMSDAHNYNAFLLSLIQSELPSNGQTVDFGAGIGTFAQRLQHETDSLLCVETDPQQREHLQRIGLETSSGLSTVDNESVDYLYSINVLEHIEHDNDVVQEFFRCLKPGAKACIYVPAFPMLYSSMDEHVGHVRRYTRTRLLKPFIAAGFSVERCRYEDFLGFFASVVLKMLPKKEGSNGSLNTNMVKFYDRYLFPLSRALAPIFGRWIGKNLSLIVSKPSHL